MAKIESININDLLLDIDNPRFPEGVDTQEQAINKMLEIQNERIIKLAKDIAEKGLDLSDLPIVFLNSDNDYVVAEGNRRIVSLKLLNNPALSDSDRFRKRFSRIVKTAKHKIKDVSCVVYNNDSYQHWVTIKHTGQNSGIGRVDWTAPETARHLARNGKSSFANQLYDFIEKVGDEYKEIVDGKKNISITNITRLFNDPVVRKCFGLEGIEGFLYCYQPYDDFVREYKKLLSPMVQVQPENNRAIFTVERIRYKDDRAALLGELNINKPNSILEKPWKLIDPFPSHTPNDDNDKLNDNPNDINGSSVHSDGVKARIQLSSATLDYAA